jgi:four helix bundle protein
MKKSIILIKSFAFAIRVVNLNKFLNGEKKNMFIKQLLERYTSVGALIREAEHAESKPDFKHKLR